MARFLPILNDADPLGFYYAPDGGGGGKGGEDDDEEEGDDDKKNKTFTQAEMNTIMAREKREGKRAGVKALLAKFDVETEEELRELIEAGNQPPPKDDGKKTQDDAAAAEQRRKESEAEKAKTKAAQRKATRRSIKAELVVQGMSKEDAEDFVELVKIEGDDPDDEAVTAAVEDLKDRRPKLFSPKGDDDDDDDDEEADDGKKQRRTPDTRTNTPPRKKGKVDAAKAADDMLKARHGDRLARNKAS